MHHIAERASLITAVCCVVACGGSGGGSTPVNTTPAPVSTKIDQANAALITGTAFDTISQGADIGEFVQSFVAHLVSSILGPASNGVVASKSTGLLTIQNRIPIPALTLPCAESGNVTFSGEIASLEGLTVGDMLMFAFTDCVVASDTSVNGTLEGTVSEFSGDLLMGKFLLGLDTVLTGLSISDTADSAEANGDLQVLLDTTQPPITITTVTATALAVVLAGTSSDISSFSSVVENNEGMMPVGYALDVQGMLSIPLISGPLAFSTPVSLQGSGDEFPFVGEFLVVADDNSAVRVIALDSANVRLEVDTDADGAPDATIDTTWEALGP